MAITTLYKTTSNNGIYSCEDIDITIEEWNNLLNDTKAEQYINALLAFLREPNHTGTCGEVALKYGKTANYYINKVRGFSKLAEKKLNRFRVVGTDGKDTYWCITMGKGWESKQGFQWQLREELVDALRIYLMHKLISELKDVAPFNGYEEEYKWQLLQKTDGKEPLEIIQCLKKQNIVYNQVVDDVFKTLTELKPQELADCINHLFDESKEIDNRIATFKQTIKDIYPRERKSLANDERTASALLTCKYPDKYTFYKDEIYQIICQYFGFECQKAGKKFSHFIAIINDFSHDYGDQIQTVMSPVVNKYNIRPLNLAVQTMFWCMKEKIKKELYMKTKFTWIPFYKELADKLMDFRNDRKSLLDKIYSHKVELLATYLHDQDGEKDLCKDIDPFTTFGIFNRGIRFENRINSAMLFKDMFSIEAEAPTDFEGIPILNNQKSHFFGFRRRREDDDIENLWALFEKVVNNQDFEKEYNKVIKQYIININITMGLFWIRPNDFLAFDSTNRSYLNNEYGIKLPNKAVEYKEYMSILNDIKNKMASNEIKEKTFYELSSNANSGSSTDADDESWIDGVVSTLKKRKNIVLYGAPGTGKTYDVPNFAVRLCDPSFDADGATREELVERYIQLKQEKRIAFTTFHQSMDYEDWMEGLRPEVGENNQVTYQIENGIFKQLCEEAERPIVKDKQTGIADDAIVWKVSLCGTGDNPVRSDCMKNNYIRIGWDDYGPVISDETDWSKYNGEGRQILDAYINKMKVGDIIMSCYSNRTIDAIGVVTGDYEYVDSLPNYKRVRKVNWLLNNINENIVDMNDGKTLTLGTVYRLNSITLDKVKALLDKHKKPTTMEDNTKPYVMVIDELNRGNVSKIFGELITLLEPDKRKGKVNAESVILPYSKKMFQIPSNVYIIATMNTADRSLGSLDYAIRRRFAFIAEKPYGLEEEGFDTDLFKQVSELFIKNYDEYEQSEWEQTLPLIPADTLSDEYKPEDVWIGHSYFLMNDENGEDNTQDRLLYEIIPLLEEYVRDGILTPEAQTTINELYKKATE